jgi:hypothetical protein
VKEPEGLYDADELLSGTIFFPSRNCYVPSIMDKGIGWLILVGAVSSRKANPQGLAGWPAGWLSLIRPSRMASSEA